MKNELQGVLEFLATNDWPFRIHEISDESIERLLNVFKRIDGKTLFKTRFIIDHAETISDWNIERVYAPGAGRFLFCGVPGAGKQTAS
ncbi:hypothetical protein RM533_02905 [Croceicoccus sp. F390]|uniref:IstB-like ATP-binding protein domain-containing protein n=1 Tax=Croceicoccus esteveae TaxID=3075597 RepID=A0ABU2ZIA4_9SPHN|nr:hypothetical protein [Croceicoccus sp. F390]MDT0575132.1 hypothetical protein [Croceicoccus sp. F390]